MFLKQFFFHVYSDGISLARNFFNILKRSGQRYNLIADFGGTSSVVSQLSIMLNVCLRTTLGLTPL